MRSGKEIEQSRQPIHPEGRKSDYVPVFFAPPEEAGVPLRLHLRIVWNRRWVVLTFVLALVTLGGIRTVSQRPVYTATGTLEIEMPKQGVTNIQDFFPSAAVPDIYLQTQSKILASDQLASQVIDSLNASGRQNLVPSESRWFERLALQKRLDVQVLKGTQLIRVGFQSEDPVMAAKTVNRLMSLYLNQIQAERSDTANDASGWLMSQVQDAKANLDQSMERLRRYEQDHQILPADSDRERLMNIDGERLQQLQEELSHIENSRLEKEAIFRRIRAGDTQALQSALLEEKLKKEADLEEQLAELTKKFGPKFPQVQLVGAALTEVRRILAEERGRLSKETEAEYESAIEQQASARREIEEQRKKVSGGSNEMMQDNFLKRDVDLNEKAYEALIQKLQEATTTARFKTVSARIVDSAEPPAVSSHPVLARNLFLSVILGLVMGAGIALAEELLRDTIKTSSEIESDLNLPLLGIVPAVSKLKIRSSPLGRSSNSRLRAQVLRSNGKPGPGEWFRLDRDAMDHYDLSEAIRNLRTSLLFALDGIGPQTVLFSSSLPSEGKTTISSNVSISLTQLGKRVLMIDGDLRRPCLHSVFSIPERVGLTEYLEGVCAWEDVVHPSGVPGLDVIVCGKRPPNPAELLSSGRMRTILEQAKREYDIILVDSPTLLNMADSRILSSYVDGVVVIIKSRATPKLLAKQACANVRGADGTIVGVVLNHLEISDSEYSYSYYGYPKPVNSSKREEEPVSQR
jgi:polysaccharide biosynthesis transport protein